MVSAQGYCRLPPCLNSFTTWRRVFIKQVPSPAHRTLHENFGARHPSSVSPNGLPAIGSRYGCHRQPLLLKDSLRSATPPGEAKGVVRIRPGFHEAITAYRNPSAAAAAAQLCIKQLYAALWSATPAKPFSGAFGWETLQGGEYGKDIGFDHRQDAAGI